jgi:hypothetical protein
MDLGNDVHNDQLQGYVLTTRFSQEWQQVLSLHQQLSWSAKMSTVGGTAHSNDQPSLTQIRWIHYARCIYKGAHPHWWMACPSTEHINRICQKKCLKNMETEYEGRSPKEHPTWVPVLSWQLMTFHSQGQWWEERSALARNNGNNIKKPLSRWGDCHVFPWHKEGGKSIPACGSITCSIAIAGQINMVPRTHNVKDKDTSKRRIVAQLYTSEAIGIQWGYLQGMKADS